MGYDKKELIASMDVISFCSLIRSEKAKKF
jgi:hypothetical protein